MRTSGQEIIPRLDIWEAWAWGTPVYVWQRRLRLDLHEAAVAANLHGVLSHG